MPLFTDEQYRKILESRARLDAFKGKQYYVPPEAPECSPRTVEHIHRHSDMSRQEFALLQQTAGEVKYLRDKVTRLQNILKGGSRRRHKDIL